MDSPFDPGQNAEPDRTRSHASNQGLPISEGSVGNPPSTDLRNVQAPSVSHSSSRTSLPQGYRQGIITAITVMLGFSLAFFRFWSFEASGEWTRKSLIAAVGLTLALALQIVALVRALRVEDDMVSEYRITVRWFVASVVILGGALVGAAAVYTG